MTDSARGRLVVATAMALASWLAAPEASALLLEKMSDEPIYTVFFPYPTSFVTADRGYAFDDDPLTALLFEPYVMPLKVFHVSGDPSMVEPRMTFVQEMLQSGDAI